MYAKQEDIPGTVRQGEDATHGDELDDSVSAKKEVEGELKVGSRWPF